MPGDVRLAVIGSWILFGASIVAAPIFLVMGVTQLFVWPQALTYSTAAIGSVLLVGLTVQTAADIWRRSRSALSLVVVQGVAGGISTLAGVAAILLHAESLVERGIFSGYEEVALFACWGLATTAAYGLIAVAVHRNAEWFSRDD